MISRNRSIFFFFFFIFASILLISLSTNARLLYETPKSGPMVEHDSLKTSFWLESPVPNGHRGPVPAASLG